MYGQTETNDELNQTDIYLCLVARKCTIANLNLCFIFLSCSIEHVADINVCYNVNPTF